MDTTKKWYLSTAVWAGIVVVLNAGLALLSDPTFGLIPADVSLKLIGFINLIAGVVGIKGRVDANSKIG